MDMMDINEIPCIPSVGGGLFVYIWEQAQETARGS